MKKVITFLAVALLAAPVWAAGTVISDNYDGGMQLTYSEIKDGDGGASVVNNELYFLSSFPPVGTPEPDWWDEGTMGPWNPTGSSFIGEIALNGATPYLYGDTYVEMDVNLDTSKNDNDSGVAFCVQQDGDDLYLYGVNYDPEFDKLQLVAISVVDNALNYINLIGDSIGGTPYTERSCTIKAQAILIDSTHVNLVCQAWSLDATPVLLGENMFRVGTDTPDEDGVNPEDVPVLSGGAVGPFAAVNGDDPSAIDTLSDNFLARGGLNGDADLDGDVDLDDLGALADNWGTTSGAAYSQGDFDLDGDVDLDDLGKLADNWGGTGAPPIDGIPEPATMSLLALGGLALLRRRK